MIEFLTYGGPILVFTHSGKPWVKEAYAFTVKKVVSGKRKIKLENLKVRETCLE